MVGEVTCKQSNIEGELVTSRWSGEHVSLILGRGRSAISEQHLRLSDKDNAYAEITSGSQSSIDFNMRRIVASHSVENDLAR